MTRAEAFKMGRRLGGLAVKSKTPPATCPQCGKSMAGRSWHSFLGHLGLHGLADAHFGGDLEAAQERIRVNGLATQNGGGHPAWKYEPVQRATP
jgi:hypothetical protein